MYPRMNQKIRVGFEPVPASSAKVRFDDVAFCFAFPLCLFTLQRSTMVDVVVVFVVVVDDGS